LRRLREDLIDVHKHLKGGCKEDGVRLLSVVPSDWTRGQWAQTETQEVRSEHHKTLTEHWQRLLRDAVESPSLKVFKTHLNTVLGNWL